MGKKVLIIDDDPGFVSLVEQILTQKEYEILKASNGQEGLKFLFAHKPDIVLLDVVMPGMDGWQTCNRIRDISDIPIIMFTGNQTSEEAIVRGLDYGADDYLTKPVGANELVARVQAVLRRAEEPSYSAYRYECRIETNLHEFVRQTLQASFGEQESGWWVKGIPLQIRVNCAQKREEDSLREELYRYTDLIDLKTIINKNWRLFESSFNLVHKHFGSKKDFLAGIATTNEVRKRVMHPIRKTVSDEDISFLKRFAEIIGIFTQVG